MTTIVKRDQVFFAFSPALTPKARVNQNTEVVIETHDCFEGQLKSEADLIGALDWDHVNPATGPVYIEGVKAGDVVRIDLLKVKVADTSIMVTVPGEGVLGSKISETETAVLKYQDGQVIFKDKVTVPAKPMIGVIGVAPAEGQMPNGTPGPHGGNMDCTPIGANTSIYFTAAVEGALFGCGDLHAAMGDGEIVICGAETAGEVTMKANVVPLKGLPTPFLETADMVMTIFSAATLDEAAVGATNRMAEFLTEFVKIPINDAGMLMSLVGNLKVCQVVDPEKTARFEFPKAVLKAYGYTLPA